MNKLDINTLTEEQKKQLNLWYKIYLNKNNKLVTEEPSKPYSSEFVEYKLNRINTRFDRTIKNYIKDYPKMEVQTWAIKLAEAEKVIAWQDSEYLIRLANDKWVDVKDLADKIKQKADEYNTMYSKLEAEKDKQIKDLTIE